jgi:hypothetical protein
MMNRKSIFSVVISLAFIQAIPAQAVSLQSTPKLGGCYLFTEKELNSAYPLTNPIPCAKVHNVETFGIGTWPLKNQPWKYTEDMARDAAEQICMSFWDYPDDSDLNYWAYFTPSPAQWAKGARWVRCDAMAMIAEKGTFKQKYATWTGNAGLTSGYLA